ncbi:MAG: NHL repeat-containing protein, partial [Solirubrobacterales bacterium]|nr:NHL repeat-containing protein [Solirubrobacterales bacterium]
MKAGNTTYTGLAALLALVCALASPPGASARTQLKLISQFGGDVNRTQVEAKGGPPLEDLCTAESGNLCQVGVRGAAAGSFAFSRGIAVNEANGDVYVADQSNNRVQEFGATGQFIRMFGGEVDETTKGDICPASPGDTCKAGVAGGEAGQFRLAIALAIEQSTGDVYVADFSNHRVQKYGPAGEFILTFGGEVNETTKGDVCRAGEKCKAGVTGAADGEFEAWPADSFVAVGAGTVYVGDKARIQEFEPAGAWKANVSLATLSGTGKVTALSVDSGGDMYLKDEGVTGVRELDPAGAQIGEFDPGSAAVSAIALGPAGDLTVIDEHPVLHGAVYRPSGEEVEEFGVGTIAGSTGIAYDDASGQLYVSGVSRQDVELYGPFLLPTAITRAPSSVLATSATLEGRVDPEGTESSFDASSLFEYGRCATPTTCATSAYGETAASVPSADGFTGEVPVEARLTALVPNQEYHYVLVAANRNGASPGAEETFKTLALPPTVDTEPASFTTATGAILSGVINPENLATQYHFEYGACTSPATCATSGYPASTPTLESAAYGELGASQELSGLRPSTTYHYRLLAESASEGRVEGPEATFTTTAPPIPSVSTGGAGSVTASAATITGTVDPNGTA